MTARAWSYDEETELRTLWGDDVVTAKIAAPVAYQIEKESKS